MDIHYTKNPLKAQSFLWTNGMNLLLFSIEKFDKYTESIISAPRILKYAKINDKEEDDYQGKIIDETPVALALSEFHYFLLHSDSLTIISRITEKVVMSYDVFLI